MIWQTIRISSGLGLTVPATLRTHLEIFICGPCELKIYLEISLEIIPSTDQDHGVLEAWAPPPSHQLEPYPSSGSMRRPSVLS